MKKIIVLICVALFFTSCTKSETPEVVEGTSTGETTIETSVENETDDLLLDDLPVLDDSSISDMIEEDTPSETTIQTEEESEEEVLRELENLFDDILEGE